MEWLEAAAARNAAIDDFLNARAAHEDEGVSLDQSFGGMPCAGCPRIIANDDECVGVLVVASARVDGEMTLVPRDGVFRWTLFHSGCAPLEPNPLNEEAVGR